MKNRYLVFEYDGYYPSGGMNDFKSSHDTEAEARLELLRLCAANSGSCGGQVYDRQEHSVFCVGYTTATKTWHFDGSEWEPCP